MGFFDESFVLPQGQFKNDFLNLVLGIEKTVNFDSCSTRIRDMKDDLIVGFGSSHVDPP